MAPLRDRSVEAIREKAVEIKREFVESGCEEILGNFWDGI